MTTIRLISGTYGGRKIEAPSFDNTRTKPMGERIRSAMFNRIGTETQDAVVLDAFAGTGSVGLEAISRGAASVTFIERDKSAQNIIRSNVSLLGCGDKATLVTTSVKNWVENREPASYDIIFADPPYDDPQLSTVSLLLGLLKPNGLMVLSSLGRGEGPNLARTGIVVVDNRVYGNARLTSFRRETT